MQRKRHHMITVFFLLLATGGTLFAAGQRVSIRYDREDAMVTFAVRDLTQALQSAGCQPSDQGDGLRVVFSRFAAGMGPQSFRIQKEGNRGIRIVAGDSGRGL